MSQFYNPVDIYSEKDGLNKFVQNYKHYLGEKENILLLTRGDDVHRLPIFKPLLALLDEKVVKVKEINLSNPDLTNIFEIIKELGVFNYQIIIAIGGGSVLDVAKALSALKGLDIPSIEILREVITKQTYVNNKQMCPWIGIPTTAGTGSEVTSWATVWDHENGKKYSISNNKLYAKACIVLPEMTLTLPLKLSVITGLDAISHATEAYWSVQTNPISRLYAIKAIEKIRENLPKLKIEKDSYKVRYELATGSLYAGLAFSNTRTTACHSISYPLTLLHGIDHGLAASVTLGSMLKVNQDKIIELQELLEAYGVEHVDEVELFIESIYEQYGLRYQLSHYGIDETNVKFVVDQAFTKGRIDNNPVLLTEEKIESILMSKL